MTSEPSRPPAKAAFVLFVAGDSPNSRSAIANLTRALAQLGRSVESIEIIDVFEQPDLASAARVLVTPTLLRRADPDKRIFGDLSVPGQLGDFLQQL